MRMQHSMLAQQSRLDAMAAAEPAVSTTAAMMRRGMIFMDAPGLMDRVCGRSRPQSGGVHTSRTVSGNANCCACGRAMGWRCTLVTAAALGANASGVARQTILMHSGMAQCASWQQ